MVQEAHHPRCLGRQENYAMNDNVSYQGQGYQAKRPIKLKPETPNFRPLPPLPPPGA